MAAWHVGVSNKPSPPQVTQGIGQLDAAFLAMPAPKPYSAQNAHYAPIFHLRTPSPVLLLCRVSDRLQAYVIRDLLKMNGITAHVFNEHMSSIVGDVPPDVALPQVWLDDESDRTRAMAVLRDYHVGRGRTGMLFCRACREENPATFEICWACGAPL